MATSIRTPTRARSSTLACTSPSIAAAPGIPVPVLSGTKYSSQTGSSSSFSSNNSTGSGGNGSSNNTPSTIRKPKPRRPSLPSLSASTSQLPTQKSLSTTPSHLLQPAAAKDSSLPILRSPKSVPRLNADSKCENTSMAIPSLIARPNTSFSTPRTLASSLPSPRIVATSRMGEGSHQRHGHSIAGSAATTNTTTSAISAPSQIAKPVLRTQKSTGIKPPSIVTKPNVPNGPGSAVATPHLKGFASQPPATPSPVPLTAALSAPSSTSPLTASSGVPVSVSPTLSVASSSSTSSTVRSRKRFNSDGDSGCFLSQASDCESTTSASAASFEASKPAIHAAPTKPIPAPPHTQLSTSIPGQPQKPPSRRPSAADIPAITTTTLPPSSSFATSSSSSSSPLPTCLTLKAAVLTTTSAPTRPLPNPPSVSATGVASSFTVATPTTPSPLKHAAAATMPQVPEKKGGESIDANATTEEVKTEPAGPAVVQCTCQPPLTLPEHVKREMKREEEEHRQRECGLYEKIIELQIENANLKGEKETLNRVISRRDKMLLELQMQLKAMEFVCREHEIKVDIDMCPDEAIENWSFKESDEVYQRILLTTQDLLRSGSRCLEENMPSTSRSSSQHHRSSPTRTSSSSICSVTSADRSSPIAALMSRVAIAGISEGAQPLPIHKQQEDPLIFKQTSRPGTMKFDIHTLLKSEQDFKSSNRAALSQANLSQLNEIVEGGGRRALDCGDDRSQVFGMSDRNYSSEDYSEDDDEGQESEFEELGEDMIKYVDLQSNVAPRRDSRSTSFPKMIPGASGSATPDMSTAVLMKNLWNSNPGARRSGGTTPLQHSGSFHGHHHHQHHHHSPPQHLQHPHQAHPFYGSPANRSSGGSHASSHNSSVMEDYFSRGGLHQPEGHVHHHQHHHQHHGAPVGVGLGLTGMGRSPEQPSLERFLAAPPTCALPPSPLPSPRAYGSSMVRSPLGSSTSSTFPNTQDNHIDMMLIRPPPMMPLPPLPARPRYSYRDHTKSKLLEFKRPSHGRTCSHGFAVEEVGQFLKRKTYGKTLTRDLMHRGHRRRDSV
ncbi:hypothetical protein BGZ75_010106 [Mortierella antarctica]|nr:hypothetical protein BGZ75_010106 [Mortierella antarctica]